MPFFTYRGESPRLYPYPPIARELTPGDVVELAEDEVPTDGRFLPAEPSPATDAGPSEADPPAPAKVSKPAAKTTTVKE
jgi:hypothetical protein